ncbi:MAG: DinB family protein [Panacagrimonas sp.]
MSLCPHFVLLATYNQWMNDKVCEAVARLSEQERAADRGAFFGSIMGTLNHLVGADTIWLHRFRAHPTRHPALDSVLEWPVPTLLNQVLFPDFAALREHRVRIDQVIVGWTKSFTDADMDHVLSYRNMKGVPAQRLFSSLVLHFFNHQTHHRGQVTTLLTQAGQDAGVTDLLMLVPDQAGRS